MKNRIYLTLTLLVVMLAVAGCGKEKTNEESTVTKTPVVENSEETEVTTDVTEEEVIGDVDITRDITIDDCKEMIVGSDLVLDYSDNADSRKTAWELFGRDDIKVLFPSGEFIISQDNSNVAETEKINVNIVIRCYEKNVENKTGDEVFDLGRYIITKDITDYENCVNYMYEVFDTESDAILRLSLSINKYDKTYGDNFSEDYLPRFEEMLLSNFQ